MTSDQERVSPAPLAPTWCSFQSLCSDAEAAIVSAHCLYSLATLEVYYSPDQTCFAIIERQQCDVWRWAAFSNEDSTITEGWERDREDAKKAAEQALYLCRQNQIARD